MFWAWNDGSGWVAPQFARLHFGGHIPLCKCYFSYVDNSPSVYDFDKKYIVDFATRFLSDVDNRMIVDGKVPSESIKINLGEELDDPQIKLNDSQIKQEELPKQIESDISPSILPTNDNFDSLLKESENINE